MTKAMELVQMQIKTNEKDHASLTKATYLGKKKRKKTKQSRINKN